HGLRHPGRGARPRVPAPRVLRRPRRGGGGGGAVRALPPPRGHDRPRRRQAEPVTGQPRPRARPPRARGGAVGHPAGAGRRALREEARTRAGNWRRAVDRGAGADATAAVADLRARLADDLDTPGALAVVDSWADAPLAGDESDPGAGEAVATAVDALLGVWLGDERG